MATEDWAQGVDEWKKVLINMPIMRDCPIPNLPLKKRPIRVLSLFDGIATGLVALKNNNILLEVYYASEIDISAIGVSQNAHPHEMVHLGEVTEITEATLENLGPIDLLLGVSPSSDLNLDNPFRKGIYNMEGTGRMFFEYFRIMSILLCINKQPFFWLYENIAAMCPEAMDMISRCLECNPVKINSAWMSPQNRNRLYWGNCPTLRFNFESEGPKLQEYLEEGRTAVVDKIEAETASTNYIVNASPWEYTIVNTKNEPDRLTMTELEKVFGFEPNYTKVYDLGHRARQELVGRAPSVQVATKLLHFLKYYYKVTNE